MTYGYIRVSSDKQTVKINGTKLINFVKKTLKLNLVKMIKLICSNRKNCVNTQKFRLEFALFTILEELIDFIASSIGSLINPTKLQNTFKSVKKSSISFDTIKDYLDFLQDSFLIEKAVRYDIKGKKYIDTPSKYYFSDLGLRNARINFRQSEMTHLMENLIYNELCTRGFSIDVGQVTVEQKNKNGERTRKNLEVDFVCNRGFSRYYIQSALSLPTPEEINQEFNSLKKIDDSFKKILITSDFSPTYQNDDGILVLNIFDFLMNKNYSNI